VRAAGIAGTDAAPVLDAEYVFELVVPPVEGLVALDLDIADRAWRDARGDPALCQAGGTSSPVSSSRTRISIANAIVSYASHPS
jgi:hypothetical protein